MTSDVSSPRVWFVEAGATAGFVEAPTAVQAVEVLGHLIRADLRLDVHAVDVRLVEVDQVHLPHRTVATVVATLRQMATWSGYPDEFTFRDLAERLAGHDWSVAWDACTCPMCQEITCDEGCPLAEVRSWAARAR